MGLSRDMVAMFDARTHQRVVSYKMGCSEVNGFEVDPTTGDIYCSLIEGTIYQLRIVN